MKFNDQFSLKLPIMTVAFQTCAIKPIVHCNIIF